jgi:hypothetical protein
VTRIPAFITWPNRVMRGEIDGRSTSTKEDTMDDTDPITKAVTELIASIPVEHLEDKPVMQALLNWFRSQEINQEDMCTAIATLLGLFVGMRAESKAYLKASLATFSRQMRSAAKVSMENKELAGEP